jgi:predicted GTPase
MEVVTLSLISHTNVGKTTLARTLLRRDVGQVIDQAHVTEANEVFDLVAVEGGVLRLWDTPGLGDSARLVRRLRQERNPLGWLLHQVWDRHADRPLFSSQQAARNIKDEADVVLYLVNATEDPLEAGYVPYEMELLEWMAKPVLVLLNQTGPVVAGGSDGWDPVSSWREALRRWSIVRDVIPLDAFTRSWLQEVVLLERVIDLLPESRRPVMRALCEAWAERSRTVFAESAARVGAYLARAAADRESVEPQSVVQADKRRAMRVLAQRLDDATRDLVDRLIAEHGLEGRYRTSARESLEADFDLPGEVAWSSARTTIVGAAMGGAAGGIVADILTAGLSFGGGAVTGAILGAAGAASLRRGFQLVRTGDPALRWAREFLEQLARQAMLRYLAVAHFGRGRGEWRDTGNPERWNALVEAALAVRARELDAAIAVARAEDLAEQRDVEPLMTSLVTSVLRDALARAYPEAAHVVEG